MATLIILIILIITEILTFFVLRQHFYRSSKPKYYISLVIMLSLVCGSGSLILKQLHSGLLWQRKTYLVNDESDRFIYSCGNTKNNTWSFAFFRETYKDKRGGHIRYLTNTGLVIMIIVLSIIGLSTFHGRFNFKTEEVTIKIKNLNSDLDGLKIVQLSDMHLPCFYNNDKYC